MKFRLEKVAALAAAGLSFFLLTNGRLAAADPSEDPPPVYTVTKDTEVMGVFQVNLPSSFPFVLDPYEIAGRGSVYSEPYVVTNNSAEVVRIRIDQISAAAQGENIVFRAAPPDRRTYSESKEIQLSLHRIGGASIPLGIGPVEPVTLLLEKGETAVFEITGAVSLPADETWKPGDVRVSMNFQVEPLVLLVSEEALDPALEEDGVPDETSSPSEPETSAPQEAESAPEPGTPSESGVSSVPEEPTASDVPSEPEVSSESEAPSASEGISEPETSSVTEPPAEAAEPAASEPPAASGTVPEAESD